MKCRRSSLAVGDIECPREIVFRAAYPLELFLDRSRIGYVRGKEHRRVVTRLSAGAVVLHYNFYTRFACMRAY